MQNAWFKRFASLFLVLAILMTCFTVTLSAADTEDGEEEEKDPEAGLPVVYNRTYDEAGKTPFDNLGINNKEVNTILLKSENIEVDGAETVNNYIQLKMNDDASNVPDNYLEPSFEWMAKQIVAEISLRKEPGLGVASSKVMYVYYTAAGTRSFADLLSINSEGVVTIAGAGTRVATLSDTEWTHFSLIIDIESVTVDVSVNGTQVAADKKFNGSSDFSYMNSFRIYCNAGAANAGRALAIDNFRLYEGTHVRDVSDEDGSTDSLNLSDFRDSVVMKVNVPYAYVREQVSISDDLSVTPVKVDGEVYVPLVFVAQQLGYDVSALSEKVFVFAKEDSQCVITIGNEYAYLDGDVISLGGESAVLNVSDQLMGNFSVVETVFPGYHVTYDEMGLIIIDHTPDLVNRTDNLAVMVELMEAFVFDNPTGEDIYNDALEKADGILSHPRVLATSEQFDAVRQAYQEGLAALAAGESTEGMYVYQWTSVTVNSALRQMGVVLGGTPKEDPVYYYDDGNRMTEERDTLMSWSFTYQVVRDMTDGTPEKVAERVLRYLYAMSQFDDWNPGHSLNCAGNAQGVALAYDWMYDAWAADDWTVERISTVLGADAVSAFLTTESGNLDVKRFVEDILYYYGIASAIGSYNSTTYQQTSFGTFGRCTWTGTENNWNAVCNGSYMMACLALMDVDTLISDNTVPERVNLKFDGNRNPDSADYEKIEFNGSVKVDDPLPVLTDSAILLCSDPSQSASLTYQSEIQWLMTNIMQSIKTGVICYAPDGSYAESPGYWVYGTGHLFYMSEALYSATGYTYGLLNAGGVDTTGYFPIYIEGSDNLSWGYHDSGSGKLDTSYLAWVGQYLGDPALSALRYQSVIEGRKSATIQDILFFNEDLLDAAGEMPLDHYFQGIETATFRSSWETGAIYTGLHGGYNSVNHGDMDAGNFIYDSNGIRWFVELGSDNYNLDGYFSQGVNGAKWKYYRKAAEGQNTVFLANDSNWPYGQNPEANVPVVDFYSDENGGYAVLDMSVAFGSDKATSAKRGLLFTNSRKTVVIQDEFLFSGAVDLYWVAHINGGTNTNYSVELAEGGTVAYLTYDNGTTQYTVRATIVPMSPTYSYHFQVMDATALLAATTGAAPDAAQQEYGRGGYQKLVIESGNTTYFGCAVVIETIESRELETGYTYVSIDNWMPVADTRPVPDPGTDPDDPTDPSDPVNPVDPVTPMTVLNHLRTFVSASGAERTEAMLAVARTIQYLSASQVQTIAEEHAEEYNAFVAERAAYNETAERVNAMLSEMLQAAGSLSAQAGTGAAGAVGSAD